MKNTKDCLLTDVFDHINDIIILLGENQEILELNHSAIDYFNCDKDHLLKRPYLLACQEQGLEPIQNLNEKTSQTKNLNGKQIHWKITSQYILIGKVLSDSDVYLSSFLDANCEGLNIYWCDLDNRLLLCNNTQARFFGSKTRKEVEGKNLADLCNEHFTHEDNFPDAIFQNNVETIASGKPQIFEEGHDNVGWCLSFKSPFYDTDHQIHGIMGISIDITQRKALTHQLYTAKQANDVYLETILLSSPNNIYWMDVEGKIIGCNDQQAKCFGLNSRLDLIGKNIFDVGRRLNWHPEIPRKIRNSDIHVMETRQESTHEETVFLNGRNCIYLTSKSPMYDHTGEVVGVMGIAMDITDLKQTQSELEVAKHKAEDANRYKTEFIANMSHDIRTPLIGINGVSTYLLENVPIEYQPDMQGIIKASHELLVLLNNVISSSHIDNNNIETQRVEPFDLEVLITQVLHLFQPLAQSKKLSLNVVYPLSMPRCFLGPTLLVQRILLNLISNALKFTSQGGVTIRVSPDNEMPLLIQVDDTGIGIPESKFEEIFENFHRLNPAYQGKYRGSGMGLYIAQRFIKTLGGAIWLTSEVGKGSSFKVRLPLQQSQAEPVTIKLDSESEDHIATLLPFKNLTALRILLVEDNILIQKAVANLLKCLNSAVDIAADGEEALVLAQKNNYDLIFMDIGLPGEDGFAVSKNIRKFNTDIPIIAVTAHLDESHRQHCLEAGINDMIIKPLTREKARFLLNKYALTV